MGRDFGLPCHARGQRSGQGLIDRIPRDDRNSAPRNRVATASDFNRVAGPDPVDEFAGMGCDVRKADRVHVIFMTVSIVI